MAKIQNRNAIRNKKLRPSRLLRKLIHLLTGIAILALTYVLEKNILLLVIIAGSLFSFFSFRQKSFGLLHQTPDASLGTVFYPIGVICAFLLLYDHPIHFFQTALMVLTVADPMANIVGQIKPGNGRFIIWRDQKSMFGIAAFAIVAFVVFLVFLPGSIRTNIPYVVLALILAASFELISYRGSDNFTIPFGLAVFFLLAETHTLRLSFLSMVLLVMTAGSYLLYRWGVLTRYGSLVAWALGFYFVGVLGYRWILPVLLFFISSVVFTKMHSAIQKKAVASIRRNMWQVLANILWAIISSILYLVTGYVFFIYFFIALVAAVTADTWASEIGPVINRKSFSLSDMQMHPAGVTGGISLAGSAAALLGSLIISWFSYSLLFGSMSGGLSLHVESLNGHLSTIAPFNLILILSLSGFLACFADTLLGAFVEEKLIAMPYFKKRQFTESLSPNDVVNLLGSATAPVFFLVLYFLMA